MDVTHMRRLEVGGGQVLGERMSLNTPLRLQIPAMTQGYTDAQIDDYGLALGKSRPRFLWRTGVSLHVRARFSHGEEKLLGTAGFGFWNAPFGDPTVRRSALPQATWFFYASTPNDLPLAPDGPGRGWFAATLHAASGSALSIIPMAPFVVLGNRSEHLRRRLWPWVQRRLGIAFAPIAAEMTEWHDYHLEWRPDGCTFSVDNTSLLQTAHCPSGPLGFVCWLDNQYLIVTPRGRVGAGVLATSFNQWLEIGELEIRRLGD